MSRQGTGVIWTIIVTVVVTSTVAAAGWFAASRFLGQETVSPAQEEARAAAPAPRRKAPRRGNNDSPGGGPADLGSSTDPARADAGPAQGENSGAFSGREPSAAQGEASASSAAEKEPANESASPTVESAASLAAGEGHRDARSVMEEAQRRTDARFYRYDGLLQSFDAKSKMTEKRWTFDRVGSNGQSKAVLRFTAPAEVKGVALLIYNHPERASDQWMWTPALERDRRIALQDRSTRFFGTDFSFEDLEERDVDQYDYAMLGNEAIDGADCWKIEMTPKRTRSSHYSRSIGWIRKDSYVLARLDNFVEDDVVKRLTNSTIENIQGIWTARQLEMADLRRGTRTRLTLQEIKYNAPVKESEFTLEAIRH